MASAENEKLTQRDSQKSSELDSVIAEAVEFRLRNMHTSTPGVVQSYDPAKQTVQVQPVVQRVFTEQGAVNLPLCVDVPVVFPGAAGFFLTHPIDSGDECLLVFGERCIDNWFANGEIAPPAEYRIHDMSDGFAVFAGRSLPKVIVDVQTDCIEMRNIDRSSYVQVENGKIEASIDFNETHVVLTPSNALVHTNHGETKVELSPGHAQMWTADGETKVDLTRLVAVLEQGFGQAHCELTPLHAKMRYAFGVSQVELTPLTAYMHQGFGDTLVHLSPARAEINVASGQAYIIGTPNLWDIKGDIQHFGSITSSGDHVAQGTSLQNHVHTGVQTGSSLSGTPQ